MVFNLIFPLFGHYDLVWVGPLGVLVFVPIIYVAITRYGLFDVRETLSRTLTYVLTLAILAALYAVLSASITSWFFREGTNSPTTYTINVIIVLCLVLVFQPIRRFFDRATNNLFYRHQYHRDDFYRQINTILGETTELRKLLSRLSVTIGSTLSSKQVFMTVYRNHEPVTVGTPNHQRVSQKDLEWLDSVARKTSLLLLDRNKIWFSESTAPDRFMVSYGLTIVLPLRHVDRIVGYVFLGEHKNQGYTRRDYEVLETITDELALAVQNALAVEEIRDLNDTLQQRIEAATSELRRSNAQLRKLDEAKDEFISMASHQLRTPLTSIKGYIDMILDGDAGAITPTQKQFLTEAFVSSERMVHLINDFLNVSRLQTGKFVIELQPTDLALLVSQELDSLRINAASRPLSFEYKPPKNLPLLMLDEAKIRQVIMNFADNSLYYSKPGTVIKVRLSLKDDAVTFTVKDTGIGVPLDDQPKLFTKFFRAANARKQRPDGTGVGLYLAKRVITEHHGVIEFASVEGKGSTFGFTLPLSKLRVHDKTNKLVDKPADN
jgi:signal transduction histidine kinase